MAGTLRNFVERHRRKLLILAAAIAVYAVLGFLLAPYLVKKNAVEFVGETYGAELRIEKVVVNPFVLSLRIDGLEMDDPNGSALARFDQFFINFQLSSVFRWAATFREIRLDAPELFVARQAVGNTNLDFFMQGQASEEQAPEAEDSALPRVIVQDFAVNQASLHWNDAVPREPVDTSFGPVNVQVFDLSTLPQGEGQQEVVITTETTGTLSWSGTLQLNPLRSAGRATIEGSHFPLLSAYVRDSLGFEAVEGYADVGLDYSIDARTDGQLGVEVDNFSLSFRDVLLRTYGRVAADGSNADREVLKLPGFRIDGGSLRLPEQQAAIGSINIHDAALSLHRNEVGVLNIVPQTKEGESAAETAAADAQPRSDNPWAVSLERIDISDIKIDLVDESVTPNAEIGVRNLDISVTDISNEAGKRFPTDVTLEGLGGGTVSLTGDVGVLPELSLDIESSVAGIKLAFLQPYIKSLADVSVDSGSIGLNASLHVGAEEPLSINGDMAVTEFLITETDEGSRLGSWDSIAAKQFAFSLEQETLDISEILVDRAYGDILIAEDGSINLGRAALGVQVVEENAAEEQDEEPVADAAPEPAAEKALPVAITIGRVVVNDGAADFEDRSLPLPFDVQIAALNGSLTTIASASAEPSTAALEGTVDEFGLVRVSGTITPLQPALNTDIKVDFENVAMPKFSAYSVPFAGRQIDSGKLDLILGYRLENSALVGENKIILRDFELGDKVDHPGASSLPLGLAVALLKGPDGTIDIDLPVRGNVNDPNFRYGRVVGKALVNLIVKIVASPFALLGKLVGAEADELEYISFQAGRADLTPPEREKAGKLAEALALRPELSIEINGVIDRDADGFAIQAAKLDAIIEQQIETDSDDEALFAERSAKILEDQYADKDALRTLREQFTVDGVFDELAFATELRRQLITRQVVEEADLVALAKERAASIKTALLAQNAELEAQIATGELQSVEKSSDDTIDMKVVLAADEGDG